MLLNLTNHPSDGWTDGQTELAKKQYNAIVDYPFPLIPPEASSSEVNELASATAIEIMKLKPLKAVLVSGEFTFVFALVNLLQRQNIDCYAATTMRYPDRTFKFVQFRKYPTYV